MKKRTQLNVRLDLPYGMTFPELALHLEQLDIKAQHVPMQPKRKQPLNCHVAKVLPFRGALA